MACLGLVTEITRLCLDNISVWLKIPVLVPSTTDGEPPQVSLNISADVTRIAVGRLAAWLQPSCPHLLSDLLNLMCCSV